MRAVLVPLPCGVHELATVFLFRPSPKAALNPNNSKSDTRTRQAYHNDVAHFMRTFGIQSPEELRKIDHRAVMAWERLMREEQGSQASTVRRRLAALSSLFAHLVKFGVVEVNPARDVERPAINRREGMTLAFSQNLNVAQKSYGDSQELKKIKGYEDRKVLEPGHTGEDLNGARKLRRSFGLMKKQWFTDTIQLRNRCPLRQSTSHLPAAYPRIDLASLVQMDPQRLGITGRLSLASHR